MNAATYKKRLTLSQIACFIALQCALPICNTAFAREYFNPALLGIDGPGKELTDLSAFEDGVGQMPGTYHVDVIVNKGSVGVHDIEFVMQKDAVGNSTLQPCLSVDTLRGFGIRTDAFPGLVGQGDCANLAAIPRPAQYLPLKASSCGFPSHKLPWTTTLAVTLRRRDSTKASTRCYSTIISLAPTPKRGTVI